MPKLALFVDDIELSNLETCTHGNIKSLRNKVTGGIKALITNWSNNNPTYSKACTHVKRINIFLCEIFDVKVVVQA